MIVRAPATSANLGPGFDCAAVALDLWNELEVTEGDGVAVDGEGAGELPDDAANLAVRAYALLADTAGRRFHFTNRIPLERGLGSSAAAIALGLVAARRRPAGRGAPDRRAGAREPRRQPRRGARRRVTLTWDGRIARIADTLPLTPVALVPRERTSTEASPRTLPATISHADAAANAAHAALLGGGRSGEATPSSSPPGSTTGCTSPTGRRPRSSRWGRPAAGRTRRDAVGLGPERDRVGGRRGGVRARPRGSVSAHDVLVLAVSPKGAL